jgi:hypothetical protein
MNLIFYLKIEDVNQNITFISTNEKYLENNIKYAEDSLF